MNQTPRPPIPQRPVVRAVPRVVAVPRRSGASWVGWIMIFAVLGAAAFLVVQYRRDLTAKNSIAQQVAAPARAVATPAPATPAPVAAVAPRPVVEETMKPAPPAATPIPQPVAPPKMIAKVEDYPGLTATDLVGTSAAGDSGRAQLLRATQWAVTTGDWQRHLTGLKTALISAAGTGSPQQYPMNLDRIVASETATLALEQAQFIRLVGTGTLKSEGEGKEEREFLSWLLTRPAILAGFNHAFQPQDKASNALAQWRGIWSEDPASREIFASLAIACALVFDQPVKISGTVFGFEESSSSSSETSAYQTEVAALARFRFYRDSAKKGSLKTPLTEMTPWELTWVVDAPVPESELVWAQKNANFSRRDWGKAYGHIRYRMDRATKGVNPYKSYTLAEIEKEGGICGDQAYFAAMTAKANGIPAMVISGEGDRGAHAWFGYESGRNEWNLSSGRYAGDSYAAGTTSDPQTHKRVKEHELRQLTDPARRAAGWQKSESLLALAALLTDPAQRDLAAAATDAALRAAPKSFAAWTSRLDRLAAAKVPTADWLKESTRMRTTFREYPDLVQAIDKRQVEYLAASGDTAAARRLVGLQSARMERKDADRTDLILDSVAREAELAAQTGGPAAAGRVYRDALKAKGEEIVGFKSIASKYYDWAKTSGTGPETVRELISFFDRKHTEPTTDTFAMGAYRGVLKQLTAMAKEQGLTEPERRLERREAKLKELEDKQGKLQSRGADR